MRPQERGRRKVGVLKERPRGAAGEPEIDSEGSWAISYGDMITLLLTFFILFFSTDSQKDRLDQMERDLAIKLDSTAMLSAPTVGSVSRGPASASVEELVGPQQFQAKVYKVGQRLIVEFPNTSFFGLGKIELTKDGERELRGFVSKYLPYAGNYVLGIRAYTDNKKVIPYANRRFRDNLELSALRAVATMRYLQRSGIPLNRMRLGGYGELNLTADELSRAVASTPEFREDGIKLARKIVLVVEPEVKDSL